MDDLTDEEISAYINSTRRIESRNFNESITPKFLLGPTSLNYMKHEKYPFKICLLSDYHNKLNRSCNHSIPVNKWIKSLVDSKLYLDIFIEVEFTNAENNIKGMQPSYITDVVKEFDPSCFSAHKSNCYIKNTRIHYTDFRMKVFSRYPIFEKIAAMVSIYGLDHIPYNENIMREIQDNIILLEKFTNRRKIMELLRDSFVFHKITKQLNNIPPSRAQIREIIIKNFQETEPLLYARGDFITVDEFQMIKNGDPINFTAIIDVISRIAEYYLEDSNIYGDTYTLARLFRSYKNHEDGYNSIIFMGDVHIRYIEDVLKQIGFYNSYTDFSVNQCLDISELNIFE